MAQIFRDWVTDFSKQLSGHGWLQAQPHGVTVECEGKLTANGYEVIHELAPYPVKLHVDLGLNNTPPTRTYPHKRGKR